MSLVRPLWCTLLTGLTMIASAGQATALCNINAGGLTITPTTASTGTFIPPTTPLAQGLTFTITGTYNTDASAGTCRFGMAWRRTAAQATMARAGGGATLPYTITSAPGGGQNLLHQGVATPPLSNLLEVNFVSAGPNLINRSFSITATAYFQQLPANPQRAGNYSVSITLRAFNIRTNTNIQALNNRTFSVTGAVALACTIGGVVNPAADSAVIPITGGGIVNVSPISRSYSNVVCNSLSQVRANSLNGAVRGPGSAPTGFSNMINYSAAASFSGATSTLNTATIPSASGLEQGTAVTTVSPTPTGNLSVTITPQNVSQPLMAGSYSDTLRITITPQ